MGNLHPVFDQLEMKSFSAESLEAVKNEEGLKILFLWGYDCPNCEVAKRSLSNEIETVKELPFKWYHCNVYEDYEVSLHFGLHGIPTFFFYSGSKRLGRLTSYPGFEAFLNVLNQVINKKSD